MKIKILAVTGIVAVLLAASSVAMAVSRSTAPHTTASACVASSGQLKLVQNGKCPSGTSPFAVLGKGGPGTALGYAHIMNGNKFDPSRSYNVAASNVVSAASGFYCFKGLKFTPRNAVITLDYNGLLNGQIGQASLKLPPTPRDCDLSSAQAEVFTGLVNPGGFTSGASLGFYIVFY